MLTKINRVRPSTGNVVSLGQSSASGPFTISRKKGHVAIVPIRHPIPE